MGSNSIKSLEAAARAMRPHVTGTVEDYDDGLLNAARAAIAAYLEAEEAAGRRLAVVDFSSIPIPEGFTRWRGFPCPVFGDDQVDVVFHNRPTEIRRVGHRTSPSGVSDGCWWWHPQYAKIIGVRYISKEPSAKPAPKIRKASRKLLKPFRWPWQPHPPASPGGGERP